MTLDLPTSLIIAGFTLAVASGLMLFSWVLLRSHKALGQWGLAFFMGALAIALFAVRGHIPDVWSILAANTILAAAYGIMWKGVRTFEGRPSAPVIVFAGAVVWLFACMVPEFYAWPAARATLMTLIGMTYSLLAVAELWRGRTEHLISRWPIMVVLAVHAATLPLRIPLASAMGGPGTGHAALLAFVMFEAVLFCMCAAYLFVSLNKERVALRYEQTSLQDPLTAVPNRRAFLQQAARIIDRSSVSGRPVALLLFDLDRFKSVNDRYGHSAGDETLVAFCRVAVGQLRPTDLFARLGGEEFGCLLPDTTRTDALGVAERVRVAFEATTHGAADVPFVVTVSVGMAVADGSNIDLPTLLVAADRALYRAKQEGRNRVEPNSLAALCSLAESRAALSAREGDKKFG